MNQILQKLLDANSRFAAGTMDHPRQNKKRRDEITAAQHPEAIVVSCSDSRLAPEIILDQGLGDLFVVRTAGGVIDDVALASIEYAAEHLQVGLIIVLGHQNCGAVKAAVAGGDLAGHLGSLVSPILAAVKTAQTQTGDVVNNAVKANVASIVNQLKTSKPILEHLLKENKLEIVGAYYSLDTGLISFI